MCYEIVKTFPVAPDGAVITDQIIRRANKQARQANAPDIRRVAYRHPESGKTLVFLTNQRRWSAQTVADIYKSRREVELFFKWIKQNLFQRKPLADLLHRRKPDPPHPQLALRLRVA